MAYYEEFHRPSSTLSIDRKPSTFFDDVNDMDAPTPILGSATTMSPTFSPENFTEWSDFSVQNSFMDRPLGSNNPFFTNDQPVIPFNNNNPYRASMPVQQPAQPTWSVPETPTDVSTPTTANPFGQDFDSGPPVNFMPLGPNQPQQAFTGMPMPQQNVRPSAVFPAATAPETPVQPMSPHSNKEWMEMSQQMEPRGPPRRMMRSNSPPRAHSPGLSRRDGVRKKNARFEIPPERNLVNIDQMIASCSDADQLKELKQQKRLLRNRQAALDSRQRKKRHTEELEEEKKQWQDQMNQLSDDLDRAKLDCQALYDQVIEKENMMRNMQMQHDAAMAEEKTRYTEDTRVLRARVAVLTEKLESTASLTDFTSDMDSLNVNENSWQDMFVDHFDDAPAVQLPQPEPTQSLVIANRSKDTISSEDKPVASGMLLLLLLCGAFVASKSSGSSGPPLPKMPDEVRAASATVLDNILKDTVDNTANGIIANRVEELEPRPSAVTWQNPTTTGFGFDMSADSALGSTYNQLVAPTKEQEAEQAFSITPAQYNSLTDTEYTRRGYSMSSESVSPSDGMSPGSTNHRPHIAATLAAMGERNKAEGASAVYTRSLLWDTIPADVVREFKRMVEESDRVSRSSPVDDGIAVE